MNPDELTIEQLSMALAKKIGVQDDIDTEYEKKIFIDLKGTEGLVKYLKETAHRDMVRYFGAATPHEQQIVRGAYARTMFLMTKIIEADKA